jgi:hypothetical protein
MNPILLKFTGCLWAALLVAVEAQSDCESCCVLLISVPRFVESQYSRIACFAGAPVAHDLFIPLVVYFFVTIAVGLAGVAWAVYSRYRGSEASVAGGGGLEGGSLAFSKGVGLGVDFDGTGAEPDGGGPTKPRESWQINFRELKFGPRIGIGNVGGVYKGWYRGRLVAIKKLLGTWYKDDDMVARFREEIMLMSRMNHPNVLKFIGAVLDRDAGNICLVTGTFQAMPCCVRS